MIIVLKANASQAEVDHVVEKVEKLGLQTMISRGKERTIIGVIGEEDVIRMAPLEVYSGVEKVIPILAAYKLASREGREENTIINLPKGVTVGDKQIAVMAGPCTVENRDMLSSIASDVKAAGSTILRGGAFKPRTSPYAFQGLGEEGLKYLREVADEKGMLVVTELMDPRDVGLLDKYADIIQIGARNMQNYNLLKEVGKSKKAVLLKRGMASTIKEFLLSAEYVLANGNPNVMLCERGIRTFETETRNTLDLNAVPVIKRLSHLPVIVDPSHGTGKWNLVAPMMRAAIACGADGLMIEVHNNPEEAISDGGQSLLPEKFKQAMEDLKPVVEAVGRSL